jgi:DNA polymerase-3 subunit gamma/tau
VARAKAPTGPGPADRDGETGAAPTPAPTGEPGGYTVVARRYRPQRFEDVVGQDHVVQALRNAIRLNRVTHAYLFSGTRGVGKTSMARIFAKCLNCENAPGPTEQPCLECDACQAIAVGQDIDVIEIDGASNNGVEAVRELRQNAGLRPSRARFKIYYIDEVHMLSTGAFNALLKTLEEPPEHVKFLFATTEKNKIPITVLSRCQSYDFAGITPDQIVASLAEIAAREGIRAEPEALRAVARRAAGSMRDAQSLLEQLLSSGSTSLSVELVHRVLGIASDERVLDLAEALADRDAGAALKSLDEAIGSGVQPVDVLAALLEFLRDLMVLAVGAADVPLLAAAPSQRSRLEAVATRWTLDSILAALQILAEARGRLRGSPHGRLIVELALARVARLEDLAELGELIGRLTALEGGGPVAQAPLVKKKSAPRDDAAVTPAPLGPPPSVAVKPTGDGPLPFEAIQEAWPRVLETLGTPLSTSLGKLQPLAISGPDLLAIEVPAGYNWAADACEGTEARGRIEAALRSVLGRPVTFQLNRPPQAEAPATASAAAERRDEVANEPIVRKLVELFDARVVRIDADEMP